MSSGQRGDAWYPRDDPDITTKEDTKDGFPERERAYRAAAAYARSRLREYYGPASRIHPESCGELARVERMSPEELLYEAGKSGLL